VSLTTEQRKKIAAEWRYRAHVFGLKPGTRAHARAQLEFYAGAATALIVAGVIETAPPSWLPAMIRGDGLAAKGSTLEDEQ
jgi:hypothetical protein